MFKNETWRITSVQSTGAASVQLQSCSPLTKGLFTKAVMSSGCGLGGTLPNCWRPMEKKDYDLSEQMVNYLCNFVRSGNPNKSGELPTWVSSGGNQKRVLILGEKPTAMGKPGMMKMVATMLTNKAVGE